MTRKDYQLIASVLRNQIDGLARDLMAEDLADALGADNPRFDREKFLQACGTIQKCHDIHCVSFGRYSTGSGQWCQAHAPEWAKRIIEERQSA